MSRWALLCHFCTVSKMSLTAAAFNARASERPGRNCMPAPAHEPDAPPAESE
eukprot:CAMPEP_0204042270 /NCGR_PEP_ID=MMETSP0360-20130528/97527_1 /ASSEMBLY_ACC=CAM_ASM_000342 /TAXON_ID=268821 /ORGANISM="Scrippsiella Hangoei, Strain SHTV-5" /LENGTH=51 /DNA_ID=CAMNT_0050988517 /DNA_START=43 /DNA_END=195 /DNA_ORIENTATION=-